MAVGSFRHRGLKPLYEGRTARRVAPEHVRKLRDILAALDQSETLTVAANWRVTFRFEDGLAMDVDYTDYH